MLTDEEIDSDSELDEYMEQQIAALPQNEINPEEDDESDSDEVDFSFKYLLISNESV
jgi:hypothetical protein